MFYLQINIYMIDKRVSRFDVLKNKALIKINPKLYSA